MTTASLFSGIGGGDLAGHWAGYETAFWCKKEKFCQRILKYYFPNAIGYEDITTTDFTIWRGRIDVLTGGFPCQGNSVAGKRLGTDDDRYLWPEMLRAIREIQPRWVVGENVSGLTNWNGGLVFEQVCADLEAEGYEVQPFILPACGVNAPHRRDRVWFVAYANHKRFKQQSRNSIANQQGQSCRIFQTKGFDAFPTQSPVRSGDDGFSDGLDGITFSKWRNESIKGFGNAWVPQVALQIFEAINEIENIKSHE